MFVITGCSKQLNYDELISDLPASTNTRDFKRSTMKYEVSLPKELKFLEKQYDDTLWFELFVDSTIPIEHGSNLISVMRYQSDEKTPKDVYQKLYADKLVSNHYAIRSKGETKFLKYPSYYIHCSTIISNQNRETILFCFPW